MTTDLHIYDLIIIGSGPAGLSAAIYGGRALLDILVLEKGSVGGQVITTAEIANYPGIAETTGPALMADMYRQAEGFNIIKKQGTVEAVDFSGQIKKVSTKSVTYQARAVVIATGARPRKLGFPGEAEFTGKGVAFCATCDGEFFKGVPVLVVGGGYAAAEEAVFLTRYASEVHVLVREDDFTCPSGVADKTKRHPKITVHYNTEVKEAVGSQQLERVVTRNNKTGEETVFEGQGMGLFIFAGTKPATDMFKDIIDMTPDGFVHVSPTMQTNVPGVYAAGDLLPKNLRQIVTAVSDGAIAATDAQHYVVNLRLKEGLPEVSPEVEERQIARMESEGLKVKKEEPAPAVSSGGWFDAGMQEQLRGIFSRLTKPVTIALFLDPAAEKTSEMRSFMGELAGLGDKLSVAEYALDSEQAATCGITRHTSAALVVDGVPTSLRFSGVPGGHEVNSIVLALYNTAGPGQEVEPHIAERIEKLNDMRLDICVSLTCHFCPDVVAACQRIASLNPKVQAEMIDAVLYPDLKTKHNLMSFPTLLVNDGEKTLFGAQTMEQILDAIEEI